MWLAGDIKEPKQLSLRVWHIIAGVVLQVGASHRVKDRDRTVQEKSSYMSIYYVSHIPVCLCHGSCKITI